ncbi:unnamed protein product [Urochloa humidicola]
MDTEKLGFIEEMTANADAMQERVLVEILARNDEAEYLLQCGLVGATDCDSFRAKVPMVEYEDLLPYIQRNANSDRSPILTGPEHPSSSSSPAPAQKFVDRNGLAGDATTWPLD